MAFLNCFKQPSGLTAPLGWLWAVFAFPNFPNCFCTPPAYFGQVCRAEVSNVIPKFYKNIREHQCWCQGEEGSVFWGNAGLPQPCQTATANQCRSLFKKAKHEQQRAHEKAEGITWEQRKKSKDVGHEEIGGNGWGILVTFTLGLIPQTYNKIHQKPIASYALKSSKLGNLMSCLKSIYFSFILPANTLNTQWSITQAFQNPHLFSRNVISPNSKLGLGQCSLDKEVNKSLKHPRQNPESGG